MSVTLPGTGAVVASEVLGGEEFQKFKQTDGRPTGSTGAGVRADYNAMVAIEELSLAIRRLIQDIATPISLDSATGQERVLIERLGRTKVDTVVLDAMANAWANTVRNRIT